MFSDENALISAPTATGKTVIMEMAIFREFGLRGIAPGRIIYLAPIKALCQQKVQEWKDRFLQVNVKVCEVTGDNDQSKGTPTIIVATPEKWDSHLKKAKNVHQLVQQVNLLLLDEVHCVGEERGATLEQVVSRMKCLAQLYKKKGNMRIVAVSATIPNPHDFAVWLDVNQSNMLVFNESERTVPLEKHVLGYNCDNPYAFENYLNYRLLQVIETYSESKPTLVFCQTQKGTQIACNVLIQQAKPNQFLIKPQQAERLAKTANLIQDKQLAAVVRLGVAYHNANLSSSDRSIIEKNFISQDIMIICTTTTLALGVNLPAHLVVVKSTLCYKGKQNYQEYTQLELNQIMGRAGRPQFDDKGVVVIMTDTSKYNYYKEQQSDLDQSGAIESYLADNVATLLNTEISLSYLNSLKAATVFISSTYFYVRLLCKFKSVFEDMQGLNTHVTDMVQNKCKDNLAKLSKLELINYDLQSGAVASTELGKDVSKLSIGVKTVEEIFSKDQQGEIKIIDLVGLIAQAKEFDGFKQIEQIFYQQVSNKMKEENYLEQIK